MDLQPAARLGDEIAHGFGVVAMIGGAVTGALIGAAVAAATVATGGVALAIMGGSIAAGGLSTFQVVSGLFQLFELPEPTTGVLAKGSNDVYINGRPAMRAGDDIASSCNGLPLSHPFWPFPVVIAEGSATVYINGKPAARLGSKMVCGAHIKSGSPDTFIGGPTISVTFVLDIQSWMHTGFEALGLLAAGAGLVLAAMAGAAVLATAVVIGAAAMAGMALLGDLGDRLGPGCRDLLQGVAGLALLGVGAKLSRVRTVETPFAPRYKPGMTEADILAIPKGERPPPESYLEKRYIDEHLKAFEEEGGGFLFTADDLGNSRYSEFNPRKFLMANSDLHVVVNTYRKTGDLSVIESALGYEPNFLSGMEIYMLTLEKPTVVMPSGNEGGVNPLWRPGGLTYPGAMREAVLDNVPIIHANDIDLLNSTYDVVRIK